MSGAPTPPADAHAPVRERMNRRVAAVQRWGTFVALALMLGAFAVYVSGALPPYVPLRQLPTLLAVDAETFVRAHDVPTGWGWVMHLDHGDMLALGGLLAVVAVVGAAYLALLPLLARQRDWIYLVLVAVQLALFALAAAA